MTAFAADNLLASAAEFIAIEADLLDHRDYVAWLALWATDGRYIVPVDPAETDFESTLNYAFDDAAMRNMRVRRLTSGKSMSAVHAAETLRSVSRFRLLDGGEDAEIRVRNAQSLVEYKFGRHRTYAANIEWRLRRDGRSFLIVEKVVRLINAGEALHGITFLP